MGTPMALNYANLFMDSFAQNLLGDYYQKTRLRYFLHRDRKQELVGSIYSLTWIPRRNDVESTWYV